MPMITRGRKLQRGGRRGASPYSLPTAKNRSKCDKNLKKETPETMKTRSKLFGSPASKYDGVTPPVPPRTKTMSIEQTSSKPQGSNLEEKKQNATLNTKDEGGWQNSGGEERDSSLVHPKNLSRGGPELAPEAKNDEERSSNSLPIEEPTSESSETPGEDVESREEILETRSSDPPREITSEDIADKLIQNETSSSKDAAAGIKNPVESESPLAPPKDDSQAIENPVESEPVLSGKRLSYGDSEDTPTPKPKKIRKNSIFLPDDLSIFNEAELGSINEKLGVIHECFTHFRERKEKSCYPFSKGVIFSLKIDLPFLERSTKERCSSTEMYANYAILDIATQWMFFRDHEDKFVLNLPAHMCEIINDKHRRDKIDNFGKCVTGWNDFFDYGVISMIVWHGQHFSIAFIVNAGIIYKKKSRAVGRPFKEDDPPVPCVLYANSLQSSGAHHKDTVSRFIRTFLNQRGGKRIFTSENLPAIDITTCMQQDSFSCGYHSIMARHAVLKSLQLRTITKSDIKTKPTEELYIDRDFSYNASEALTVRDGIRELVTQIARIKEAKASGIIPICDHEDDLEKVDGPLYRPKAAAKAEEKKKKLEMKAEQKRMKKQQKEERKKRLDPSEQVGDKQKRSVKNERKKAREDYKAEKKRKEDALRLGNWRSRLELDVDEEEREKCLEDTKRHVDRLQGAPATSLQHYKDKAYRRGLYNLTKSTSEMIGTCNYKYSTYDHVARTKIFTIIVDNVGVAPHLKHSEHPPIRKKPLRIAIGGGTKEEFKEFIKDTRKNLKEFVVTDDPFKIDELVMGTDRQCLPQFIGKKSKKDCDSDREEDKEKSATARDDLLKSAKKNVQSTESFRVDDGF